VVKNANLNRIAMRRKLPPREKHAPPNKVRVVLRGRRERHPWERPAAPTGFFVQADETVIHVTWAHGGEGVTGFRVYRREYAGPFSVRGDVAAGLRQWTDDALDQGVMYQYRMVAYNPGGESAPTDIIAAYLDEGE
jgi:hypothetical protein